MSHNKAILTIAALAAAILIFISAKKSSMASHMATGQAKLRPLDARIISARPGEPTVSIGSVAEAGERRRQYNKMMQTGLREIPSKLRGDRLEFKFHSITFPLWCTLGDFDFLKASTDKLFQKDFLISIEPLGKFGPPVSRQRMSLSDFSSAQRFTASFTNIDDALDYGVYICFDRKNTNECGSKKVLAAKDWNKSISNPVVTDRIIYFQMITVKSRRSFLIPSDKWDDVSISLLKKNLHTLIENVESLDTLQKLLAPLGSVPGRIKSDTLELPLPYKDPNCSI